MTEATIWGLLNADDKIGPVITWRLDLRARWQLVLQQASQKLSEDDSRFLRKLNKLLVDVTRDRNIIVHGMVHAKAKASNPRRVYGQTVSEDEIVFDFPPSWTIFRGAEAGKCFQVSTEAVLIVCENIQRLAEAVQDFNIAHGFTKSSEPVLKLESGWPKRIEL